MKHTKADLIQLYLERADESLDVAQLSIKLKQIHTRV